MFFFTLKDSVTNYTVYDMSDKMREYGWQLPAYSMPADMESMSGLRVVVRNGMGHSFANLMLKDLKRVVEHFERLAGPLPAELDNDNTFHH